jgi:hypothetical protein
MYVKNAQQKLLFDKKKLYSFVFADLNFTSSKKFAYQTVARIAGFRLIYNTYQTTTSTTQN